VRFLEKLVEHLIHGGEVRGDVLRNSVERSLPGAHRKKASLTLQHRIHTIQGQPRRHLIGRGPV
jgi:hypothetical protein